MRRPALLLALLASPALGEEPEPPRCAPTEAARGALDAWGLSVTGQPETLPSGLLMEAWSDPAGGLWALTVTGPLGTCVLGFGRALLDKVAESTGERT